VVAAWCSESILASSRRVSCGFQTALSIGDFLSELNDC
jgi:hypothetical protein